MKTSLRISSGSSGRPGIGGCGGLEEKEGFRVFLCERLEKRGVSGLYDPSGRETFILFVRRLPLRVRIVTGCLRLFL